MSKSVGPVTIALEDDLDFISLPVSAPSYQKSNGVEMKLSGSGVGSKAGARMTLLLAPASLAAAPAAMAKILEAHPRHTADLQMADRVAAGLVSIPEGAYTEVLLLSGIEGKGRATVEDRGAMSLVAEGLAPGGILRTQDGSAFIVEEEKEAVLAGLVAISSSSTDADGNRKAIFKKPDFGADGGIVKLSFGKKGSKNGTKQNGAVEVPLAKPVIPAGVGFSDDLSILDGDDDMDEDEELVDENELLDEDEKWRKMDIRRFFFLIAFDTLSPFHHWTALFLLVTTVIEIQRYVLLTIFRLS